MVSTLAGLKLSRAGTENNAWLAIGGGGGGAMETAVVDDVPPPPPQPLVRPTIIVSNMVFLLSIIYRSLSRSCNTLRAFVSWS